MTMSEHDRAAGTRAGATAPAVRRELIRAAAARLPGVRLLVGVVGPEKPIVLEARPDGTVAAANELVLPMQALFARARGHADLTADLVPAELAGEGPVAAVPIEHDGFRGVLVVAGVADRTDLESVADGLALGLAALHASTVAAGPSSAVALADLAGLLASSPQPGRTLTRMAASVVAATSFDRCTVLVAGHGGDLSAVASESRRGPSSLTKWRVILGAAPIAVTDAVQEHGLPARMTAHLEGEVLVVPMVVWEEPVGVVVCDGAPPGPITEDESRLVDGLAAQAALAVKISHLVDALEQGRRHARLVLGAMAHTATQLSTDGVLSVIAEAAQEVLGDATVVAFTSADGRPVTIARSGELSGADEVATAFSAAVPPAVTAAHYGHGIASLLPSSIAAERALVVPVRRSGRHLATVVSYGASTLAYRNADLRVIGALASQAALSLHTVRLLETEREAVAHLEEVSKLKSGFVATVSHELRTPLTAILGFSEILNEWIEDSELRSFVEDVRREAVVLEGIIGNLLDTTRLEAGVLGLDRSPVDLELLVKEAVDVVSHGYPAHRLEMDIGPALPQVWGDQVRVRQILINLLENAAKYGREGGEVRVTVTAQPDSARVEVIDQGPGIPAEYRERVFERFFRLDETHGKPGTGIGLYLVRELVEAHGGTVAIEEGPDGVGCRVVVDFPAG